MLTFGILADNLDGREPRPFWSTHAKAAAEYEKRIAGRVMRLAPPVSFKADRRGAYLISIFGAVVERASAGCFDRHRV